MHFSPLHKSINFLSGQVFCPPPLTDMSAKNARFFGVRLPLLQEMFCDLYGHYNSSLLREAAKKKVHPLYLILIFYHK